MKSSHSHCKRFYYTVEGFKTKQTTLMHSRKVSPAVETGEKFILWQKLEKSSFCSRNRGQAPRSACCKHAPGRRGIVCAQAGPIWVLVGLVSTSLLRTLGASTAGGSPAQYNNSTQVAAQQNTKKAHYIKMATPLGSWDQDGENEIFLHCKHVSKSLPKQDM